jgi:hypothetical protein
MSVETRIGKNEAIFREVNERIQELNRGGLAFDPHDTTDFVCECSDEACFTAIPLTLAEYEHVRSHPARFVVAPGHVAKPRAESVIRTTERFEVVEKLGGARDEAVEADPRVF